MSIKRAITLGLVLLLLLPSPKISSHGITYGVKQGKSDDGKSATDMDMGAYSKNPTLKMNSK